MKIEWIIEDKDVTRIIEVLDDNKNEFTRARKKHNVDKENVVIDKDSVLWSMLICLLTSQQRSGPETVIGKFFQLENFLVTYNSMKNETNKETFIRNILVKNNLTRYINRISSFFDYNVRYFDENAWIILEELQWLNEHEGKQNERHLADKLDDDLQGFGPKQSRNFLQSLGLTKYEIPIDSRIIRWLQEFGFPIPLSSSALGDKKYYHFVLDRIQDLCQHSGVYPCMLDAAIFSSYDEGKWNEFNVRAGTF